MLIQVCNDQPQRNKSTGILELRESQSNANSPCNNANLQATRISSQRKSRFAPELEKTGTAAPPFSTFPRISFSKRSLIDSTKRQSISSAQGTSCGGHTAAGCLLWRLNNTICSVAFANRRSKSGRRNLTLRRVGHGVPRTSRLSLLCIESVV